MSAATKTTRDPADLLSEYARTRDVATRNQIVERYHYVAIAVAEKLCTKLPREVEIGDLVCAGGAGLMAAVENYDGTKGVKFATYAANRIRGAILDWLRDQDWVPRLARQRHRRVEAVEDKLRAETGLRPTPEEVAGRLKLKASEFRRVYADANMVMVGSLSKTVHEDGGNELCQIDVLTDRRAVDPASDPRHTALRDVLLMQFNLPTALIVRLYYVDGLTFRDIGEALGVSESRISQLHGRTLRALRGRHGKNLYELLGAA
jgi:RNA polymerase sigma factor for flagellar operon FliA